MLRRSIGALNRNQALAPIATTGAPGGFIEPQGLYGRDIIYNRCDLAQCSELAFTGHPCYNQVVDRMWAPVWPRRNYVL